MVAWEFAQRSCVVFFLPPIALMVWSQGELRLNNTYFSDLTGDYDSDFQAELLFKDENIVAIYELLDSFCEFIMNLSYICWHKYVENFWNEVSSHTWIIHIASFFLLIPWCVSKTIPFSESMKQFQVLYLHLQDVWMYRSFVLFGSSLDSIMDRFEKTALELY